MVNGEPAPTVTWGRNKGDVADSENYKTRYDERSQEHILEVIKQKLHLFVRVMYCTSTQLYMRISTLSSAFTILLRKVQSHVSHCHNLILNTKMQSHYANIALPDTTCKGRARGHLQMLCYQ